jgi:hypothetical protein
MSYLFHAPFAGCEWLRCRWMSTSELPNHWCFVDGALCAPTNPSGHGGAFCIVGAIDDLSCIVVFVDGALCAPLASLVGGGAFCIVGAMDDLSCVVR